MKKYIAIFCALGIVLSTVLFFTLGIAGKKSGDAVSGTSPVSSALAVGGTLETPAGISSDALTAEFPDANASVNFTQSLPVAVATEAIAGKTAASAASKASSPASSNVTVQGGTTVKQPAELRAVWISYIELEMLTSTDKSYAAFQKKVNGMFDAAKAQKMNAVMVHVRSHNDAYYKSSYFPWTSRLTGTQGKDPGYDPLAYMVKAAHDRGLQFHAWINPYRVASSDDLTKLADNNPAKVWMTNAQTADDNCVMKVGGGLYLNPAESRVRELIVNGVREIVKNYAVDGIHFDDYFYPSAMTSVIDAASYKNLGGGQSLQQFRRDSVNKLVKGVYDAVKAVNKNVVFGISPSGNIDYNLNTMYADVRLWGSTPGYVDYLCPQIYFGFNNAAQPFETCLNNWCSLTSHQNVKLYIGLALYKSGTEDKYAGESGLNEWKTSTDILKRQVLSARKRSKCNGFMVFSFGSFESDACQKEVENLMSVWN